MVAFGDQLAEECRRRRGSRLKLARPAIGGNGQSGSQCFDLAHANDFRLILAHRPRLGRFRAAIGFYVAIDVPSRKDSLTKRSLFLRLAVNARARRALHLER
jgi:hypothetical protein